MELFKKSRNKEISDKKILTEKKTSKSGPKVTAKQTKPNYFVWNNARALFLYLRRSTTIRISKHLVSQNS